MKTRNLVEKVFGFFRNYRIYIAVGLLFRILFFPVLALFSLSVLFVDSEPILPYPLIYIPIIATLAVILGTALFLLWSFFANAILFFKKSEMVGQVWGVTFNEHKKRITRVFLLTVLMAVVSIPVSQLVLWLILRILQVAISDNSVATVSFLFGVFVTNLFVLYLAYLDYRLIKEVRKKIQ